MSNGGIGRRDLLASAGLLVAPSGALAAAPRPRVVITTGQGAIVVELEAQKAPLTSANFLNYVKAGKYDGGNFYRAARTPGAPTEGTIVATSAPGARPFAPVAHESTTMTGLKHTTGVISLGRFAPGTGTADFFICASPLPYLDAHPGAKGDNLGFAAFGQVVQGMAVVRKILSMPTRTTAPFAEQRGEWLKRPVPIVSARRLG